MFIHDACQIWERPPDFELDPTHSLSVGNAAAYLGWAPNSAYYYDSSPGGILRRSTLTGMTPSIAWSRSIGRPTLTTDGVNHYIDTAPILRQPGNFWVSAWLNASALTNAVGHWIVNQRTDDADGLPAWWQLHWAQSIDAFAFAAWDSSDVGKGVATAAYTTLNTWVNVIGYISGGNVKISLNGVETVGDAIGTVKTPTAYKMRIGMNGWGYPGAKYGWNGRTADVIVGNGTLTEGMRMTLASPDPLYGDWIVPIVRRTYSYASLATGGVRFSPWILKTRRQRIGA